MNSENKINLDRKDEIKRGGYIDMQISDLKESGECDGLNMVDVFESLLNHEDLRAQDKHHINLCLFAIYRTFPSMSDLVEKHMLKVVWEEFTKTDKPIWDLEG